MRNATAALSGPYKCSDIKNFLMRDGVTVRDSWHTEISATQPPAVASATASAQASLPVAPTTPKTVICKYCKKRIDIDDGNHYMETCPALNKISEPCSPDESGSVQLTPYAARMASMTLLRPTAETPKKSRSRLKR